MEVNVRIQGIENITPINGSVNSFVADGYPPETK